MENISFSTDRLKSRRFTFNFQQYLEKLNATIPPAPSKKSAEPEEVKEDEPEVEQVPPAEPEVESDPESEVGESCLRFSRRES